MIYEAFNYNKNEDLGRCALCHKVFKEADPIYTLNLPQGPFVLVHKECYEKLIHDVEDSETETAYVLNNVLKLEDKLWRYMDLAKFISMMKSSTLYFSSPEYFEDIFEGAHGMLKNKQVWDNFYLSYARAAIITAPDNCWHEIEKEELEKKCKINSGTNTAQKKGIKQQDTDCKNYEIIESKVYSITKLDLDYQLTWPAEQEDNSKTDNVEENE